MASMAFRGLEIHNRRMWNWKDVDQALDFMTRFEMNTLIFHQVDLIDAVVYPDAYFGEDLMWERWPVRYVNVAINRKFLQEVIRRAKDRGIDFYLEVKEIWYPEGMLEVFPELTSEDGQVCPNNPFWFEFLRKKMDELLEVLPDLGGIIVSPATRESKVTISTNSCTCERCRTTDPIDWYAQFLEAMYRPLEAKKKKLVVRDFSYSVKHQSLLIDAANSVSRDIIIGLKNVPHDFWPTFPDNPKLGSTDGLAQWVEFDVWGQYCGEAVFPCSLVEDLQKRIRHSENKGATGVWFRTDIEFLHENNVFNSFNTLNLIGAALLSRDPALPLDEVYRAWTAFGLFSGLRPSSSTGAPVVPTSPDAMEKLRDFMKASWSVLEKTIYVRGHVFQYSTQFQASIKSIHDVMVHHHGRAQWDPASADYIEPTPDNLRIIFAEKDAAVEEVKRLKILLQPEKLGLPGEFVAEVETMLDLYVYYVRGFHASALAYFSAILALKTKRPEDIRSAKEKAGELHTFNRELAKRLEGAYYPHYLYWMMDIKRLEALHDDIMEKLGQVS